MLATRAGGVFLGVSRRQQSSPSAANSRKLRFLLWWNCTQLCPGLTAQAPATAQPSHPIDETPRTARVSDITVLISVHWRILHTCQNSREHFIFSPLSICFILIRFPRQQSDLCLFLIKGWSFPSPALGFLFAIKSILTVLIELMEGLKYICIQYKLNTAQLLNIQNTTHVIFTCEIHFEMIYHIEMNRFSYQFYTPF